jgi:integrase
MASKYIEDRWYATDRATGERVKTLRYGQGLRYRARYVDESGRTHSRSFADKQKKAAQRWLDEQTASIVTGQYVDPKAGRITFREYAEGWRKRKVHRPSTQAHTETMLRRHAYPTLGDRPLSSILPSEIEAWVKWLGTDDPRSKHKALAPATIGVVHSIASSVMKAAVRDRRIVANPCEGTKLPQIEREQVVPLTTEQVTALADSMPPALGALVTVGAGTGMRQGECFGLTVDRIDFLRRTLRVDQQLVTVQNRDPFLAPPKTKASVRTIPLPQVVIDALGEHLAMYPPGPDGFVFALDGEPIRRSAFGHVWRPAVEAAGLPSGTGFHALRHYYASLLIRHGESVKTVQSRLGHASATETLVS